VRYRYSASGEREQKRLYSGPGPDGEGWAYYLLASRTQHAVYHGMQTVACEQPSTMVFIAPVEYLGYGGGEGLARCEPTGTRTYTISDHLGSLRALVNDTGVVIRSVDYEPFGDVYAENGQATRREFLNLERDRESALGDHGVRKYDAELERFVSSDSRARVRPCPITGFMIEPSNHERPWKRLGVGDSSHRATRRSRVL